MAKFTVGIGVSQWVQLPDTVRRRIAELFDLEANGGAVVENGKLKHDRHTEKDLQGITLEKMQTLTQSESTNYFELFDRVLEYIENEKTGNLERLAEEKAAHEEERQKLAAQSAMATIAAISDAVQPIIKKRGRPAKV